LFQVQFLHAQARFCVNKTTMLHGQQAFPSFFPSCLL
jgi:hypothetical protein